MSLNPTLWNNLRVLVTGHTGFKGTWLSHWLLQLGAKVSGFSLPPDSQVHRLFLESSLAQKIDNQFGDIANFENLSKVVNEFQPQLILHLAAQALVRQSYKEPLTTYATNVMGTAHVLEAARQTSSVTAVVVVTTDKCYENQEWLWPYREVDRLGGHDPYSNSKACAELVADAYRRSFLASKGTLVATVRAGNVIGGGDLSEDRLIPDAIRAFSKGKTLEVRSPGATRPWQHVLDPLHGYLLLAQKLLQGHDKFADAFNFGPDDEHTVGDVVKQTTKIWGDKARFTSPEGEYPHEASRLHLDSRKARHHLGWRPRFDFTQSLEKTVNFYRRWHAGESPDELMLEDLAAHQDFGSPRLPILP